MEDMAAAAAAATQGEDTAVGVAAVGTVRRASKAKAAVVGGTRWRALGGTHPSTTLCGSSCSLTKTVRRPNEISHSSLRRMHHSRIPSFLLGSSDPVFTAGDGHLDVHELPPALYGLLNYDANNDGRKSPARSQHATFQLRIRRNLENSPRL